MPALGYIIKDAHGTEGLYQTLFDCLKQAHGNKSSDTFIFRMGHNTPFITHYTAGGFIVNFHDDIPLSANTEIQELLDVFFDDLSRTELERDEAWLVIESNLSSVYPRQYNDYQKYSELFDNMGEQPDYDDFRSWLLIKCKIDIYSIKF